MKKIITKLCLLSFFLLSLSSLKAQTFSIGTGTTSNTATTYPAPFGQYYTGARHQMIYRKSELQDSGAVNGLITQFGLNVTAVNGSAAHLGYTIKMTQTSATSLTGFLTTGMTTVFTSTSYQPVSGWNMHTLSTPFTLDTSLNLVVEICFSNGTNTYSYNASTQWTTGLAAGSTIYNCNDATGNGCPDATPPTSSNSRPNAKFTITAGVSMSYSAAFLNQNNTFPMRRGINNQDILRIAVVTAGNTSPINATQFNLSTNGTSTTSFISRARIFYTGTNPTFDTLLPFGSILTPSGSFTISGSRSLAPDTNYFWLTYDVTNSATTSSIFDAECSAVTVASVSRTISPSSVTGNRIVLAPLSGDFLVGTGQTFVTIQDIQDALFYRGVSANTRFLLNDVSYTLTSPVTITPFVNTGNFSVSIKPNASIVSTITGSINVSALIRINASNVQIDGSNTTNGISRDLTLTNTSITNPIVLSIVSSGTTIINNNAISNCNIINGTQNSSAIAITDIGGSAGGYFSNTLIKNNSIQKAYIGTYIFSASLSASNITIDSNTISGTGTNAIRLVGVYMQGVVGGVIRNNFIGNFENTNTETKQGIWLASGTRDIVIARNRISNIGITGTGNTGIGIRVTTAITGANISIRNNMIDSIYGSGATTFHSALNPAGINLAGTQSGIQIVYNTIRLGGNTLNASNANSACVRILAGSSADVRNNYLYNVQGASTTGVGTYSITLETAASQLTLVNSNNYFSGASGVGINRVARIGTTDYTTLASWKALITADANSFSENTPFVSVTDPHIQPFITSQMEGSAVVIAGITNDFDDDLRSTTSPDVGADEFAGTAADLTAPGIIYTALNGNSSLTTRVVNNIAITDVSGVDVTTLGRPRIYYKKTSETNQFLGNSNSDNGWKFVSSTNTTSPFSFTVDYSLLFSTIAVGDTIQYFVVAQDLASTPNIGANPSTGFTNTGYNSITSAPTFPNTYRITNTPLSGNYNIDSLQTSPNYTSLTNAINDLNSRGVSGPVTFTLTQDIYNTTYETFPLTINEFIGASATNRVTIKPATGLNVTITSNVGNGAFRLNGADFVTINGSNNGTNSRNLTIANSANGTCVWLSSLGFNAGATNNIITNTNIVGSSLTAGVTGIVMTGNSIANDGDDNDNNTISFNRFNSMSTGIFVRGGSTGLVDSLRILNNRIGSDTALQIVDFKGIDMARVNASNINSNTVFGMVSTTTQKAAIELNGAVTNTTINTNTIRNIEYVGTGGWAARGISASTGTGNNNITIANNMITGVLADAWGTGFTYQCIGILLNGGTNYNVHFNTINMTGQRDNSFSNNIGANIWVEAGLTSGVSLRNNILTNSQTSINSTAGFNYAVYVNGTGNPFSTINHNLYNSKTTTPLVVTPYIGRINGVDITTLANWRTATSGDLNSTGDSAFFVSNFDAHLNGSSIGNFNLKGSPISGITTDIDGQTRNTTFPYMGADEITTAPLPVNLISFNAKKLDENVLLTWITASETNNKGFEIQRSIDGINFKTIDFVKGAGNSVKTVNYTKTDLNAFDLLKVEKIYYRLNQIDFDGNNELSNIREVTKNETTLGGIKVYPNPFNNAISIETNGLDQLENTITVNDITGKLVSKSVVIFEKGNSSYTITNLEKLPAGIYFVKVANKQHSEVFKLVKN